MFRLSWSYLLTFLAKTACAWFLRFIMACRQPKIFTQKPAPAQLSTLNSKRKPSTSNRAPLSVCDFLVIVNVVLTSIVDMFIVRSNVHIEQLADVLKSSRLKVTSPWVTLVELDPEWTVSLETPERDLRFLFPSTATLQNKIDISVNSNLYEKQLKWTKKAENWNIS